jgi:hypothetical protein
LFLAGCATYTGVGSEQWHTQRLEELQAAYDKGELEAAEYFKLKNEADGIRQDYYSSRRFSPHYHFGYGYYRHWR